MSAHEDFEWLSAHPRDVLRAHGLRANRALGQNFLVAARDFERVVEAAELEADDVVLEIGTGLGRLTARLAQAARRVVTVEIDSGLYSVAAERLAGMPNVTAMHADFLQSKHEIDPAVTDAVAPLAGSRALIVVSNLPYSISSPAIVNLLEWDVPVARMCLMLQKEVADRLMAKPGGKEYGPLTVIADYWAETERAGSFPRQAFWPPPEVASALVLVSKRPGRAMSGGYAAFAETVARLFAGRRKTLGRNLREGWGEEKAAAILAAVDIEASRRAETLSTSALEAIAAAGGPPRF
jgi:16S rRNA (adenine1518-N6/adenine1519-N6)-dimethyltransferase